MSKIRNILVVRNPRNLENLSVTFRNEGFDLEKDRNMRYFYYQVRFDKGNDFLSAAIVHYRNGTVLTASSKEPALANQLYKLNDIAAAENVGTLLARRCLKAGIYFANKGCTENDISQSEKMSVFHKALEKGGLVLHELDVIKHYAHWEFPEPDYGKDLEAELNEKPVVRKLPFLAGKQWAAAPESSPEKIASDKREKGTAPAPEKKEKDASKREKAATPTEKKEKGDKIAPEKKSDSGKQYKEKAPEKKEKTEAGKQEKIASEKKEKVVADKQQEKVSTTDKQGKDVSVKEKIDSGKHEKTAIEKKGYVGQDEKEKIAGSDKKEKFGSSKREKIAFEKKEKQEKPDSVKQQQKDAFEKHEKKLAADKQPEKVAEDKKGEKVAAEQPKKTGSEKPKSPDTKKDKPEDS